MDNAVRNVIVFAFWVMFAADLLQFLRGYAEAHDSNCRSALMHPVLSSSYYAHGCSWGAR